MISDGRRFWIGKVSELVVVVEVGVGVGNSESDSLGLGLGFVKEHLMVGSL